MNERAPPLPPPNNNNSDEPQPPPPTDGTHCADCGEPISPYFCLDPPRPCEGCHNLLCGKCYAKRPLIDYDPSHPDTSNNLALNHDIHSYCLYCFEIHSTLDFQRSWEVIQPPPPQQQPPDETKRVSPLRRSKKKASSSSSSDATTTTVVMIHGGGASRCLFRPHADYLAQHYGYNCVLLDLPGHGTLFRKSLTLDACRRTLESVLLDYRDDYCNGHKLGPTILLAGSLGAYLSFYLLYEFRNTDFFDKAVLLDCGQNVGPGASWKAVLGLWAMKTATQNLSNKTLMRTMVDVTQKSKADTHIVDSTFGAGVFFDQGPQQIQILETIEPARYLPALQAIPILYMNGSEDYRDSEQRWLELSSPNSQLHVFEGGDHFFTHDSRFFVNMLQRIHAFIQQPQPA